MSSLVIHEQYIQYIVTQGKSTMYSTKTVLVFFCHTLWHHKCSCVVFCTQPHPPPQPTLLESWFRNVVRTSLTTDTICSFLPHHGPPNPLYRLLIRPTTVQLTCQLTLLTPSLRQDTLVCLTPGNTLSDPRCSLTGTWPTHLTKPLCNLLDNWPKSNPPPQSTF